MGEVMDENNIPNIYLDWDYDTFNWNVDTGQFTLYGIEPDSKGAWPEFVYLAGFPMPGVRELKKRLAKHVEGESCTYKLVLDEGDIWPEGI